MSDDLQLTDSPLERARRKYGDEAPEACDARLKAERKARIAAERAQVKMPFDQAAAKLSPKARGLDRELVDGEVFPFGAHKRRGVLTRDVDVQFLNWFLANHSANPWCGPIRRYLARIQAEQRQQEQAKKMESQV